MDDEVIFDRLRLFPPTLQLELTLAKVSACASGSVKCGGASSQAAHRSSTMSATT